MDPQILISHTDGSETPGLGCLILHHIMPDFLTLICMLSAIREDNDNRSSLNNLLTHVPQHTYQAGIYHLQTAIEVHAVSA